MFKPDPISVIISAINVVISGHRGPSSISAADIVTSSTDDGRRRLRAINDLAQGSAVRVVKVTLRLQSPRIVAVAFHAIYYEPVTKVFHRVVTIAS